MTNDNPKAAWQSLGITMPLVAVASFMAKEYGLVSMIFDPAMQANIGMLIDVAIPPLIALGIWGRMRARAVINRWW